MIRPPALRRGDVVRVVAPASPFDAELANGIRSIQGVADADARRNLPVRLLDDPASNTWRDLQLFTIPDCRPGAR